VKKANAAILPPDRPIPNSYWVIPGRLLAGEHPSGPLEGAAGTRLQALLLAGIDCFVDLTEAEELADYRPLLPAHAEHFRFGIADMGVPFNVSQTRELLSVIHKALARDRRVYVHCKAGIGRTGLAMGCFLAEEDGNGRKAIARLNRLWRQSARAETWPQIPQTAEQADYIRRWPSLRGPDPEPGELMHPSNLVPVPKGPLAVGAAAALDASSPAPAVSVVIPTYNEALNLEELVRRLTQALDPALGLEYELIVVDDDSPDKTWELAQRLSLDYPRLRVMRRIGERGLASAVIRGWQAARAPFLCVIDADLQHPPDLVVELYRLMERGADMAAASRHVEGGGVSDWSMLRRIVSRAAQLIGLVVLPGVVGRVSDPMSGYFMIRRSAIEGVALSPLGYKILIEVLARGRFPWIGEVPYVFHERAQGGSKATIGVYLDYLRHLIRLRTSGLPINRFLRFAAVGLSGVIVDMGLLFLLSDPTMLGWGLTRSKLVAAEAAIINNFLWNDAWTFGDVSARQRALPQRLRRFGKFQLICLAGVVLNTILLNLQFNLLHMNRYVANGVAIAAVTGWNFWLNLKLSWRVAEPSRTGAAASGDRPR
jgi:dolichol-phosphate mannosyltransferase